MTTAVRSSKLSVCISIDTVEDQTVSSYLGNARGRARASHASAVRHANSPGKHRGNLITNQPHPATGEPEYTDEDTAYILAIDAYCRRVGRRFLQASEYKSILETLGYVVVPHGFKIVQDDEGGTAAA